MFFLLREGSAALETFAPGRGRLIVETLHPGELVGWSWLFPPYRAHFDVRALEPVRALSFDGACLRGKCETDHDLGYELQLRFSQVLIERLDATQLRLLDLYGSRPRELNERRWRRCPTASRGGPARPPTPGRSSSSLQCDPIATPGPGQFTMLYAFGVGEVPISSSGDSTGPGPLVHTVRAVGAVSRAICAARPGDVLGVRGPFGNMWPLEPGGDVVIVAGGIGLAPLRDAIHHVIANRHEHGEISLLYGARTPEDLLYKRELQRWRARLDIDVEVTVDGAGPGWRGRVGLVTKLIEGARFDPAATRALVVGPEVMMRFVAAALLDRGIPASAIYVSMERNMRCGIGLCGHCQLGPTLICRDGAVYSWAQIEPWLVVQEL